MHVNSNDIDFVERQLKPLVSIAIPTYNRACFLQGAIDSALAQTYEPIEVIVSDNASSDDTAEILSSYRDDRLTVYQQHTNIGLIGNWNACLNMAKGDYFLMLSDDDRLAPNAIQELVDGFEIGAKNLHSKEIAFVYGCSEINNREKNKIRLSHSAPLCEPSVEYKLGVLRNERISYPSATLFRTKDAIHVGGYNTNYPGGPDVIMAFEISCLYPNVMFTGTITTYYLFHPENYTSSVQLSALIDVVSRYAQLTITSIDPSDTKFILNVIREGRRAQASTLVNICVSRWKDRSMSIGDISREIWFHRKIFNNLWCAVLLLKGMAKLIPLDIFYVHKIFPR